MKLTAENLVKQYPKKRALDDVSFELTEGVYGLLGPNGAGKTTLINIIAGILRPTSGRVLWDGEDIGAMDWRYREILGFQPQNPALYKTFRADEFLRYMAAVKGMKQSRRELDKTVEELLDTVNLRQDGKRKIGEFSGGMRQRLGIAQALLNDPKLMFFGAAAQFGIFFTFSLAALLGFPIKDAAAIGIIGAAHGPTAIFMANFLRSNYLGAIMVAAYSYMALVPIVQPPVIRALTTTHERRIRMPYHQHTVSRRTKILFPIIITAVCGIVSPRSVALVGFLMFGNLIRVCGVLDSLSETAQKTLSNLITLFLGLTIAVRMQAEYFLTKQTLLIMALGLVAFIFDTAGGVLVAKVINLFLPKEKKLNPMIGACGISAFPMSARVVYKMAIKEDPQNYLLMQCVGVNVSGQVASVIAGGLLLNLLV